MSQIVTSSTVEDLSAETEISSKTPEDLGNGGIKYTRKRNKKMVVPFFLKSSIEKKKCKERKRCEQTDKEEEQIDKKNKEVTHKTYKKRDKNKEYNDDTQKIQISSQVPEIEEITKEIERLEKESEDTDYECKNAYTVFRDEALKHALLTADEEKELSKRIQAGDEEAYKKFVQANYRLVIACAKQIYAKRGKSSILEFMDLVQEGLMGLLIAVQKFDWRKNTRFSTYGIYWINQRIDKATDSQREGFSIPGYAGYCVRRHNEDIRKYLSGEMNSKNTPNSKIKRIRELASVTSPMIVIDQTSDPDDSSGTISPDLLSTSDIKDDSLIVDNIEKTGNQELFHKYLQQILTPDEYDVLCRRHGMGKYKDELSVSLKDIACSMGRSVECIRLMIEDCEKRIRNNPNMLEINNAWFTPQEFPLSPPVKD